MRCATRTPSRCAALIDGGVDLLLVETIFDTLNVKAAIVAISERVRGARAELPIMITVTITDQSGRTLSGQTVEAFWTSRRARQAARGRHQLRARREARCGRSWPSSRELAPVLTSCYPNAGLPNAFGGYDETPGRHRARCSREFAESGLVNIVGGCCGTTPDHIRAIARAVAGVAAARAPGDRARSPGSRVSSRSRSGPTRTS